VVDLSSVQDVREGRGATGKPNTLQLVTANGAAVAYVVDTGEPGAKGCVEGYVCVFFLGGGS
jgi:hypothetical protein